MHIHGSIIRPPTDIDSVFIEITAGCSHNSCTFCNFYKDTPFWVAPLSQIDEIMIGIEFGDDEVLKNVNKGYTSQDILDAGKKMDEAGITYRMIYLGGLAGKGKLVESARKSAKIFNQIMQAV